MISTPIFTCPKKEHTKKAKLGTMYTVNLNLFLKNKFLCLVLILFSTVYIEYIIVWRNCPYLNLLNE